MRHTFTLSIGESRLLNRTQSEAYKSLDEALNQSNPATKKVINTSNFMGELDRLHTWAGTEIAAVKTRHFSTLWRASAGNIAKLVINNPNIYDGLTAEVRDAIERQAFQAWQIAQKKVDDDQGNGQVSEMILTREIKLSAGFLQHKADICAKVKADLQSKLTDAQNRLKAAKGFDKGSLKNSIKSLNLKLQAVAKVGGDTDKAFAGSVAGEIYHDIDSATKYFTQTFSAYAPGTPYALQVPEMIQKYADGDATDLQNAIEQTAQIMFPSDGNKQREQIEAMQRIAAKIVGDQGVWRFFKRRMVDMVAPGFTTGAVATFAGGALIGTGVGAVAFGAGLGLRAMHNYYRYGNTSRSESERGQAKSYMNQKALLGVAESKKIKDLNSLSDRIKALEGLQTGARIRVEDKGAPANTVRDLVISTNDNKQIIATAADGSRYCIDLEGYGTTNIKYPVSVERGGKIVKRKSRGSKPEILINNDANDCLFTISA